MHNTTVDAHKATKSSKNDGHLSQVSGSTIETSSLMNVIKKTIDAIVNRAILACSDKCDITV
jgi:hypothetical protein